MTSAALAAVPLNGTTSPAPAEKAELYARLLRLRDVVVAGKHPSIKLPASAIERLKATFAVSHAAPSDSQQFTQSTAVNGTAFATNHAQLQQPSLLPAPGSFSDLQTPAYPANGNQPSLVTNPASAGGLDPIFLEKSDSLIRAEGQLKRQRLDRDLQAQVDQRKHSSRDRDPGVDAPSPIDIDAVLLRALERVKPVSGLHVADKSGDSSSFDENDYYSSQVQSDWSSEASAEKGSDNAAGAFTADFERLDGAAAASVRFGIKNPVHNEMEVPESSTARQHTKRSHVYNDEPEDVYEVGHEEDEYIPPDATAFDSFREDPAGATTGQTTPPDDDNSEYEPGEISDTYVPTPPDQAKQPPRMQVRQNELIYIAAPQPSRVSPLATAKGPVIELELVNGRPELVQKPQGQQKNVHSRASTASPSHSGNGVGGGGRRQRKKKRKRDSEPSGRSKRKKEKQAAKSARPSWPQETTYIKPEPMSPPPLASTRDAPHYYQAPTPWYPPYIDLGSPRYASQPQYLQPPLQAVARATSPQAYRPVQRDTQDLRRVVSLQHAQPQPSPHQRTFSPVAPYRAASLSNSHSRLQQGLAVSDQAEAGLANHAYYTPSEHPGLTPWDQPYQTLQAARGPSTSLMPPPAAPRKLVVDQHGNRYYAADPIPSPAPSQTIRSSAVPPDQFNGHAPSQSRVVYEPTTPSYPVQYEMAPPPPPSRIPAGPEQYIQQIGGDTFYSRDRDSRTGQPNRYAQAPTSPTYRPVEGYEQFPRAPQYQQPTSPVYEPTRTYSVRPEEPAVVPTPTHPAYLRHASVAPIQYARQDATAPSIRAASVMPGGGSGGNGPIYQHQPQQQRAYSQVPQGVRYVDQYGNEVFPSEVREVRY